jgi:hypothetical protein
MSSMTEQPGRERLGPADGSRDSGSAWEIERVPPGAAWVAVTRRGSWVHVIAAHDLDTLRGKIEAAQRAETSPDPGTRPPAK